MAGAYLQSVKGCNKCKLIVMAKNRWYTTEQDAYIAQRVRQLRVRQLSYGRRAAVYQRIAREFQRQFRIRHSWAGIQQRIRKYF